MHVACDNSTVIINSTIANNLASTVGGGLHVRGELELVHSTIFGNTAHGRRRGGELVTDSGGGIHCRGILHYTNSIVAGNPEGGDCVIAEDGVIETNSGNLVEDGSCAAGLSGDPMLGSLSDLEIGMVYPLQVQSPAVDAVDPADCIVEVDQRGLPRPQGADCDIGAFELEQ